MKNFNYFYTIKMECFVGERGCGAASLEAHGSSLKERSAMKGRWVSRKQFGHLHTNGRKLQRGLLGNYSYIRGVSYPSLNPRMRESTKIGLWVVGYAIAIPGEELSQGDELS